MPTFHPANVSFNEGVIESKRYNYIKDYTFHPVMFHLIKVALSQGTPIHRPRHSSLCIRQECGARAQLKSGRILIYEN